MRKLLILTATHVTTFIVGFAVGIYVLPILTAPEGPSMAEVEQAASAATYRGEFRRDLKGSDALHWGEGGITVGPDAVVLMGRLAPGPDYQLYLTPSFVETEAEFEAVREQSVRVGDVKTFENFIVPLPETIDPDDFNTVVVWCESFSQFISAASYR
jgi:hypothetical protein